MIILINLIAMTRNDKFGAFILEKHYSRVIGLDSPSPCLSEISTYLILFFVLVSGVYSLGMYIILLSAFLPF